MLNAAPAVSRVTEPGHWYGAQLAESDWRVAMPAAVIQELEQVLDAPGSAAPEAPPGLPAARAFLERVREQLFSGSGVAVAGRLPVDDWGIERARRAVGILAHLMGPPTQQTHDGVTLYAVEDRGLHPGATVRRSRTNAEQPFHSDGPWVRQPPWVVALYCLRAATTGGLSACVSLRALLADLERCAPELALRLTRDLVWHRQSEHDPGETPVSRHPIAWRDDAGRWCGRYYADYVFNGYRQAGEAIDPEAQRALETLEKMAGEEHRRLTYRLEAGDVAWLNNRWCVHSRTGFEAAASCPVPRQLVRVWHRLPGDPVALDA